MAIICKNLGGSTYQSSMETSFTELEQRILDSIDEPHNRYLIMKPTFMIGERDFDSPTAMIVGRSKTLILDARGVDVRHLYSHDKFSYHKIERPEDIPPLPSDCFHEIIMIPPIKILHTKHDMRIVFEAYRRFEMRANSIINYDHSDIKIVENGNDVFITFSFLPGSFDNGQTLIGEMKVSSDGLICMLARGQSYPCGYLRKN